MHVVFSYFAYVVESRNGSTYTKLDAYFVAVDLSTSLYPTVVVVTSAPDCSRIFFHIVSGAEV